VPASLPQGDPAVQVVLAHVPQDVGELQRDTEVVGHPALLLGVFRPVNTQRQAADGAGHAAAVPEQVVERLVAGLVDVGEAAVDQLAERRQRYREPRAGVGQRDEHRVGLVEAGGSGVRRQRPPGGGDQREHLRARFF